MTLVTDTTTRIMFRTNFNENIIFDFIFQGTSGMKYSLVSRDWIADCIEITHAGYTGVRYIQAIDQV